MKNFTQVMKPEHLTGILALSEELGYPIDLNNLNERFQILSSPKHHELFVYENDRGILGFIHVEAVDDLIEERKVEIKALVVKENERGTGVGHELVQRAIEWARNYPVNTIYLNCNTLRNRAHKFYEKEGFKQFKTSHFFEMSI